MMKWPVAAVGFLTAALGATPDEGHTCIRRLRAVTVKHMGDLWAAQVTRRREVDDSEVMEDLRQQWHDTRRFTPRMPTWAAVSKTRVFQIRNLLLKWRRRKATATDVRQPKITKWLSTTARGQDSSRGAVGRLTTAVFTSSRLSCLYIPPFSPDGGLSRAPSEGR